MCSRLHFESLVSSSSRIYWDPKKYFVKKWIVVRSHSTLVKQIYDCSTKSVLVGKMCSKMQGKCNGTSKPIGLRTFLIFMVVDIHGG